MTKNNRADNCCFGDIEDAHTQDVHPKINLPSEWKIDYNFTWSEEGVLNAGSNFKARQILDAGSTDQNCNRCDIAEKDSKATDAEENRPKNGIT